MHGYWATGRRSDVFAGRFKAASEPRQRLVNAVGTHPRVREASKPVNRRVPVAIGLKLALGLVVAGLAVGAAALAVYTVSALLLSGSQHEIRHEYTETTALELQHGIVEQRRSAVAVYAANVADFQNAVSRRPAAPGSDVLGFDVAELRRREAILAGLILECINAVDMYNLGAQSVAATELRSAGLPERFVWSVDCAATR